MAVPAHRRPSALLANTVTFPRTLRNAIPEQELSAGRVLALDSVDARASHGELRGRRVHLTLRVKETGRLTGIFDLRADLDVEAAEGLATLLQSAVEQARKQPASPDTGAAFIRRRKR